MHTAAACSSCPSPLRCEGFGSPVLPRSSCGCCHRCPMRGAPGRGWPEPAAARESPPLPQAACWHGAVVAPCAAPRWLQPTPCSQGRLGCRPGGAQTPARARNSVTARHTRPHSALRARFATDPAEPHQALTVLSRLFSERATNWPPPARAGPPQISARLSRPQSLLQR